MVSVAPLSSAGGADPCRIFFFMHLGEGKVQSFCPGWGQPCRWGRAARSWGQLHMGSGVRAFNTHCPSHFLVSHVLRPQSFGSHLEGARADVLEVG